MGRQKASDFGQRDNAALKTHVCRLIEQSDLRAGGGAVNLRDDVAWGEGRSPRGLRSLDGVAVVVVALGSISARAPVVGGVR